MRFYLFLFTILLLSVPAQGQHAFYDTGSLQKIEVFFNEANWDFMLDTAKAGSDNFVKGVRVVINGETFYNIGVKYKGNSSYDATYAKNPLHIELNTWQDQDYHGIQDIKLSNGYADPSMVREVLSYSILRNYLPAPQSNFVRLFINNNYMGIYSSSESVGKDYCSSHYYGEDGVMLKCNPELTPSPSVKSNLRYLGNDSTLYYNYYELKSEGGWKKLQDLCDSLSNKPSSLEQVLRLDRFIWMLAFNNLFVNLDSYSGAFAQNYYLYRDNTGRFTPIPWDLNMSFGGFPFAGASNTSLGNLSISNMQNLTPALHSSDAYWPVIKAVYGNPLWKKMYIAHLKTLCNEFVANGKYLDLFDQYTALIDTSVKSDTKTFFTYNDFRNSKTANIAVGSYSVPGIQTLMSARNTYLQSNSDFTLSAPVISGPLATSQKNSVITASVSNATTVYCSYRYSPAEVFTRTVMFDDGQHSDGVAGDGTYGTAVSLPGNHLQYFIIAENDKALVFSPERAEQEFHSVNLYPSASKGEILINELLASNKSDVRNEFHSHEDWIEIMNRSGKTLSLDQVYLSDDAKKKTLYQFPPGTTIGGDDLLVVWADDFKGGSQIHCGFKLNEDGESVILSDGLTKFDQVTFAKQEADKSLGRCPDGEAILKTFNYPSYRLFNCLTGIGELEVTNNRLLVYPNPARGSCHITCSDAGATELSITDIAGRILLQTPFNQSAEVSTSQFSAGVYIITCGKYNNKLIITD